MTTILLVRHGQASLGAEDYDQLSPLGLRQCALLGEWWRHVDFDPSLVVSGRLRRHRQSAQACLAALEIERPLAQDGGFDEFDAEDVLAVHRPDLATGAAVREFFEREVKPEKAFQAVFGEAVLRWMHDDPGDDYREPWPVFRDRVLRALSALAVTAKQAGHARVAVFTSGGPIGVACQHALGIPDGRLLDFTLTLLNGGITHLRPSRAGLRVDAINAAPHLEVARDRSLYTYR